MRIIPLLKWVEFPQLKKKLKDLLIGVAATAFIVLIIAWPIHGLLTGY
ncbi:hypothetical protein AB1K62_14035 [Parasphingorhabdus sp. JC815]